MDNSDDSKFTSHGKKKLFEKSSLICGLAKILRDARHFRNEGRKEATELKRIIKNQEKDQKTKEVLLNEKESSNS